ncbi:replicative DNA helicase [Deinococcus roseus]|uniref:DNA 5'-3' helicase n=1 Tax=Deinococcus roseus TaxID=392414 RepID=A0ABQ2D6V3_9DEIO|nr:replicative DNA helicase [Deinococcus roseus]GGJ48071.1 replicative DNA helicase [Deinococcus roseus]
MIINLPHDLKAEAATLGAFMAHQQLWQEPVAFLLTHKDFYDQRHRLIFGAMTRLRQQHKPVDLIHVCDYLTSHKQLDNAGGPAYISSLPEAFSTMYEAVHHARLVIEKSTRRHMIQGVQDAMGHALDLSLDNTQAASNIEVAVLGATRKDKTQVGQLEHLGDLVDDTMERIKQPSSNDDIRSTGFATLDRLINGFSLGDLIYLMARPSMGKTSIALSILESISKSRPCAFFSLEMPKRQILYRLASLNLLIPLNRIISGDLDYDEKRKIGQYLETLKKSHLYIYDKRLNIRQLEEKCERFHRDHGDVGIFMLDHLGFLGADQKFSSSVEKLENLSNRSKQLAKELDTPFLMLWQLSRDLEKREDKRPMLSDARGSGAVEQDADIVMFIYRDDYYQQNKPNYKPTGLTELLIAKQRNGPPGMVPMMFRGEYTRFDELQEKVA